MADSGRLRGWKWNHASGTLETWVDGTLVNTITSSGVSTPVNGMTIATGGLTVTAGGITVTADGITITDGGLVVTAGGATVTAGDLTVTAGDAHVVAENLYMGAETAFGTTEPTSAIVFKIGTAPVGAITTSCGIFTDGTVLLKIIAAGTANNIET